MKICLLLHLTVASSHPTAATAAAAEYRNNKKEFQ
jgi:hypothetical protein